MESPLVSPVEVPAEELEVMDPELDPVDPVPSVVPAVLASAEVDAVFVDVVLVDAAPVIDAAAVLTTPDPEDPTEALTPPLPP